MSYKKAEIPQVARCFQECVLTRGRIITRVEGEFKLVQCSPTVLKDVLGIIDGKRTFSQVEDQLAQRYPADAIPAFLDALLSSHIIEIRDSNSTEHQDARVLLIGDGLLYSSILNRASGTAPHIDTISTSEFVNTDIPKGRYCCLILSPESATFETILKINRIIKQLDVPLIPYYFDGKECVLGPLIIPGKTACMECIITHHLDSVNGKLGYDDHVSIEDIGKFMFAFSPQGVFDASELSFFTAQLTREVEGVIVGSDYLKLLDHELRFAIQNPTTPLNIAYYPTTCCRCCNGLSKNYSHWSQNSQPDLPDDELDLGDEVRYRVGGFRSRDENEAKVFITDAIRRTGLTVEVSKVATPFERIIPVFRAQVKASYRNKSQYYFRDLITHGKGLTETQAFLSAAFETAERLSSYYYGDIPLIEGTCAELGDVAIDLRTLSESIGDRNGEFDRFNPNMPIDWVWAKSLISNSYKLVPASLVFIGGTSFKGQFMSVGSSGLSAGATLPDAILQGLMEVIEHDAWVIGQANTTPLPLIDISTCKNEKLKNYIEMVRSLGYEVISRDYTTDLGIPVFRTWMVNKNNHAHYALNGVGAAVDPELALERSVTEAIQSADNQNLSRQTRFGTHTNQHLAVGKDSIYCLDYFRHKDILSQTTFISLDKEASLCFEGKSVNAILDEVIGLLKSRLPNCDVLYVNLTHKVLGVPVVRIIVTGDIQRLNYPLISVSPRTYNFNHIMGYGEKTVSFEDLYLGPYPH